MALPPSTRTGSALRLIKRRTTVMVLATAAAASTLIVWLFFGNIGYAPAPSSRAVHEMVVTADPRASAAGLEMLRVGGSAVDAAIAAELVLTLVEPQSSGIGGGFYMLVSDMQGKMRGYDAREMAPASTTPRMFLDRNGRPIRFSEAGIGGRAVGVPGVIAGFGIAHARYGKLPWARLFAPAIRIAERGFVVSPLLARDIKSLVVSETPPELIKFYFRPNGDPYRSGDRLRDPSYAQTLREIAAGGPDAFYKGRIADEIVKAAAGSSVNPGRLTHEDLRQYQPKEVNPVCLSYRGFRVCSLPPSTSGGVTLLEILGMLERFPSSALEPDSLSGIHLITQASRLAYADRAYWIGDPAFVTIPVQGLLDKKYLAKRAALIDPKNDMGKATAGHPVSTSMQKTLSPQRTATGHGTSHLTIIDRSGLIVSTTTSIQSGFGAQIRSAGFLLNNQLTDFSFEPQINGRPVANASKAGKRPISSMSPVIIFRRDHTFFAALGSPGGSDIIAYNVQAVSALIDGGLSLPEAFSLPHFQNANGKTVLESRTMIGRFALPLWLRGHRVRFEALRSGLTGIRKVGNTYEGAADPRGEGVAVGE